MSVYFGIITIMMQCKLNFKDCFVTTTKMSYSKLEFHGSSCLCFLYTLRPFIIRQILVYINVETRELLSAVIVDLLDPR